MDIEIFPTAIEDWSENSAENITQQDIDRMIVQYQAIRGSSKPVNNLDITGPITIIYMLPLLDRKSTRLNSSHLVISYAVFCLKKKNKKKKTKKNIKKFKDQTIYLYN